jgi:hypothetical protein
MAYNLEILGINMFLPLWMAGLGLLTANAILAYQLICHFNTHTLKNKGKAVHQPKLFVIKSATQTPKKLQ